MLSAMPDADQKREREARFYGGCWTRPRSRTSQRKGADTAPPPPGLIRIQADDMSPALTRVDLRNAALVNPEIGRNVMLEMPRTEALPNAADNFVVQFCAVAPFFACHGYRSLT